MSYHPQVIDFLNSLILEEKKVRRADITDLYESLIKKKTIKKPFDVFHLEAAAHLPYLYVPSVPVSLRYTPTSSTLDTYRYKDIKRKKQEKPLGRVVGCGL